MSTKRRLTEHPMPVMECPWCSAVHTRASNADTKDVVAPSEGDFTLCIKCGEWCAFHHGHLVIPTEKEFEEIGSLYDCHRVRAAWQYTRDRMEKPN